MKLIFLGVSSALSVGEKQYQANMLIESGHDSNILIDCGTDIKHSLYDQGFTHRDIDAVYVSHLHADHVGGLEWLGFSRLYLDHKKPLLFISPDQQDALWNQVLSGGMSCIENKKATLSTYFQVSPIAGLQFTWENHLFQLIKTCHYYNNHQLLPSYGLIISGDCHSIYLSTDSRFSEELLISIADKVDIIFHDCEILEERSGQHANYHDLKTLDPKIKNKMWLYGYQNTRLPNAKKDGFKGFVTQGQSFIF